MSYFGNHRGRRVNTHVYVSKFDNGRLVDVASVLDHPQYENTVFGIMAVCASHNRKVLALANSHPRVAFGYAMCQPKYEKSLRTYTEQDSIESLEQLFRNDSNGVMKALKTSPAVAQIPINDPRYDPYLCFARDQGKPLMFHCSTEADDFSSTIQIEDVARRYPDLVLVLAHMGGKQRDYMQGAIRLAEEYENVHLNTTTIDPERAVSRIIAGGKHKPATHSLTREEVWEIFMEAVMRIPKELVFGDDGGYYDAEDCSAFPLPQLFDQNPQAAEQILYHNAMRVFDLSETIFT